MESKNSPLPPREKIASSMEPGFGSNLAYQLALQRLIELEDIESQCRRSGAECSVSETGKVIIVRYLNRLCSVILPGGEVSWQDTLEPVPLRDRILILHYLLTARGAPLSDKLVTFRELPDGAVYHPTFTKRTIQPLVSNFGSDPDLLLQVAAPLGARKADFGDVGITIDAFPRVPLTIALWRGDEEFPPQGNVLFDSSISDYLPTEDVTILSEVITWRLVRSKKP